MPCECVQAADRVLTSPFRYRHSSTPLIVSTNRYYESAGVTDIDPDQEMRSRITFRAGPRKL